MDLRAATKQLGYAAKDLGKRTRGSVWTKHGVVSIGSYTTLDSFGICDINGVQVSIAAPHDNLSGAVQSAIYQSFIGDGVLFKKVFG